MAPCQSHSSSHSNLFFDGCGRFFTHSECGVVPAGPFRTDFHLVYICSGLQMHCLHNWLLSLGNNKLLQEKQLEITGEAEETGILPFMMLLLNLPSSME